MAASGGGSEIIVMGAGGAGGGGGGAGGAAVAFGAWGCSLISSSSRYWAVILSSELEGTLASFMPNCLALVRTTLFSRPSFFAKS